VRSRKSSRERAERGNNEGTRKGTGGTIRERRMGMGAELEGEQRWEKTGSR
jgi:hypothetical protein